jgi:hypothetical protein
MSNSAREGRWFRFSLQTLLLAATLVAVSLFAAKENAERRRLKREYDLLERDYEFLDRQFVRAVSELEKLGHPLSPPHTLLSPRISPTPDDSK